MKRLIFMCSVFASLALFAVGTLSALPKRFDEHEPTLIALGLFLLWCGRSGIRVPARPRIPEYTRAALEQSLQRFWPARELRP